MTVALPNIKEGGKKKKKKNGRCQSSMAGSFPQLEKEHSGMREGAQSSLEVSFGATPSGIPWLDEMMTELDVELRETELAGKKVGAHVCFGTKFAPVLQQDASNMRTVPQQKVKTKALLPLFKKTLGNTNNNKKHKHSVSQEGRPVKVAYAPTVTLATSHARCHSGGEMTLRDYLTLAQACQRAGKAKTEASAYYKVGEICAQNPETLSQALRYFERYYTLCKRSQDSIGEAKALNCLGIVHQEMKNYEDALKYHTIHSQLNDSSTRFIAFTNIGIVSILKDDYEGAMNAYKAAMQYAIRSGDKSTELMTLSNLASVARKQKDFDTSRMCTTRHLELAQLVDDSEAQQDAHEQYAFLHMDVKNWSEAHKHLSSVRSLATTCSDQLKCKLGIVKAASGMEEHFKQVALKMGSTITA